VSPLISHVACAILGAGARALRHHRGVIAATLPVGAIECPSRRYIALRATLFCERWRADTERQTA
jgi:hypothetical protein